MSRPLAEGSWVVSHIYHSEASLEDITASLMRSSIDFWGEERTRELEGRVRRMARDITILLHAKLDRFDPEPYFPIVAGAAEAGLEGRS
jgi:hypothetical protein